MDKTSFSDSTAELHDAIRKLEAFSNQESKEESHSSIFKTISLVRSLFFNAVDPSSKNQQASFPTSNEEVLNAVELITRKRFFIEQLKKAGSPDEKNFAEALTKAVASYNERRDKCLNEKMNKGKGWSKFLSREGGCSKELPPKIDLSEPITVAYHYSEKTPPKSNEKQQRPFVATKAGESTINLTKQYVELFQMKALALLERYGIASNPEARVLVKQSPIFTEMQDDNSCTLCQTLTLFPGQTVTVMGTSALDPKNQTISKLFPDTFSISLESTQTGFPHPSQRAGWTLGYQLLPESPQRLDLLQTAAPLFQNKKLAMQELQPHGKLIKTAKALLRQKKRVFHTNSKELLTLHKQLAEAIVKAALPLEKRANHENALHQYFEFLEEHPEPFECLVETYQQLRDSFLAKPHQILLEAILKGKSTDLASPSAKLRQLSTKNILEQALVDAEHEARQKIDASSSSDGRIKWTFIHRLGIILGSASTAIILQYLSEDLIFSPPPLNPFEQKVQSCAYKHMDDFLKELSIAEEAIEDPMAIHHLLKEALISDIALFQTEFTPSFSQELDSYFKKRYSSLSLL